MIDALLFGAPALPLAARSQLGTNLSDGCRARNGNSALKFISTISVGAGNSPYEARAPTTDSNLWLLLRTSGKEVDGRDDS